MLLYAHLVAWLSQFEREEEGQGLVEYALIIVLVSIASIATLTALGTTVAAVFTTITAARKRFRPRLCVSAPVNTGPGPGIRACVVVFPESARFG